MITTPTSSTIQIAATSSSDVTIGAFGSTPNANGLSINGSQVLNMQPADATHPGGISIADWNTFNNKQSALTFGNFTDAGTDGIVVTGGTGAVIGSGTSIAQHVASASFNGYLSSTDWSTFNSKQAAGNYITALTGGVTASGPGSVVATVVTNANLTGPITSVGNATSVAAQTGTGSTFVMQASPTLTTPDLGTPSALVGTNISGTGASFTAGKATVLATARTINGTSFDGSANITITAAAGTLTGTTLNSTVVTSSLTAVGTITTGVWNGTTIAVANGGTGVTSVTTTPTASSFAGWDASKNFSADSFISGYATTATAAGTTTLTVGSTQQQYFTGTTTQTVVLPVTSTLVLGQTFYIVNNSTGVVTVQSSGANTVQAMAASSTALVTCILTSGTTAASWSVDYNVMAATTANLPIVTGWVTYTPTFQGFGTPSSVSIFSRRVGDTLQVQGSFVSGTSTAAEARIGLGFNGTADNVTAETGAAVLAASYIGQYSVNNSGSVPAAVLAPQSDQTYVVLGNTGAGTVPFTVINGNAVISSGQRLDFWFTVPIVGWSANSTVIYGPISAIAPTVQVFTSGTAATYTTPTSPRSPLYLKITAIGGGGGGGEAGGGAAGAAGGTTTFKKADDSVTYISCVGGGAGSGTSGATSTGGSATVTTFTQIVAFTGTGGQAGYTQVATGYMQSGYGGSSPFGGGGPGNIGPAGGIAAVANTGSGGSGGAGGAGGQQGSGGAAGGYAVATVASPAATYHYTIGAGGAGGTGGAGGDGAAGAAGIIIVEEFYQ